MSLAGFPFRGGYTHPDPGPIAPGWERDIDDELLQLRPVGKLYILLRKIELQFHQRSKCYQLLP